MKLTIMAVLLPIVVLLFALPAALATRSCPSGRHVSPPYECWNNHDHNQLTFHKIDCNSNYNAASLAGCKAICTPHPTCFGLVFIPDQYGWASGKYCCFLKRTGMKCEWIRRQQNRITCRWIGTGGDSGGDKDRK